MFYLYIHQSSKQVILDYNIVSYWIVICYSSRVNVLMSIIRRSCDTYNKISGCLSRHELFAGNLIDLVWIVLWVRM